MCGSWGISVGVHIIPKNAKVRSKHFAEGKSPTTRFVCEESNHQQKDNERYQGEKHTGNPNADPSLVVKR